MKVRIDLAGEVFGRWTVLSHAGRDRHGNALWSCRCACGTERVVNGATLRQGISTSCGCLRNEVAAFMGKDRGTHGMSRTPTYQAWCNMMTRCYNRKGKQYKDYGGRGITVCETWHEFSNFLADMGPKPDGLTLDRIDNDKGYGPDNCRWANRQEQSMNRQSTVVWEGKTLKQWQEETGMNYYTLHSRLKRYGTLFPKHLEGVDVRPKS